MTPLLLTAAASLIISAQSPGEASIPLGAQRVEMQRITLEASCEADVRVSSLTVTHGGLGAASDIMRTYVMEGPRRVSRAVAVTGKPGTALLRLPSLRIPRCQKRELSVMADFSPDAANQSEHRLGILTPADVVADTDDIGGSVRTDRGTTRIAPVSKGTIEVEYLPSLTSVSYGAGRTLLRIRLTARDEDQDILSVTLTNDGRARDTDLQNLSLGTRSTTLTNILPSLSGDKATFTFDSPLRLERGQDILLLLRGDVRASRRKTIRFSVEEESDIVAGKAGR